MSSLFPPSLTKLAAQVSQHLHNRNETISFAETATGGLLSSSILSRPGASKVFLGGLTLYTLPSRLKYAGWTQADIDAYRGPNAALVAGIARHVNGDLDSTYTLCESGTAGPTGGTTRERTPGFVALAVFVKGGEVRTKEIETGSTDREGNMLRFAEEAFKLLLEVIEEKKSGKM